MMTIPSLPRTIKTQVLSQKIISLVGAGAAAKLRLSLRLRSHLAQGPCTFSAMTGQPVLHYYKQQLFQYSPPPSATSPAISLSSSSHRKLSRKSKLHSSHHILSLLHH